MARRQRETLADVRPPPLEINLSGYSPNRAHEKGTAELDMVTAIKVEVASLRSIWISSNADIGQRAHTHLHRPPQGKRHVGAENNRVIGEKLVPFIRRQSIVVVTQS